MPEPLADSIPPRPRLDSRLWRHRLRSPGHHRIAVIARVRDPAAWRTLTGGSRGVKVGQGADGHWLVTGRLRADRLEEVATHPSVVSLVAAHPVRPQLKNSLPSLAAQAAQLPSGTLSDGGRGVVVGVVDYGGDFAHANLRRADGSTRLLCLWDQTAEAPPGAATHAGYGRVYSREEINRALAPSVANPYAALGYAAPNTPAESPAHGTLVLDIAAGNGRGTGQPGMAPNADLVFVELSAADAPDEGEGMLEHPFADSAQLLEAVHFVFDQAAGRPCVVNLSLGTNEGPHDGTSLVEQGLDLLAAAAPNRAIVLAAGNAFADATHASGTVLAGGSSVLRFAVPDFDADDVELEIWYPGAARLDFFLASPDGKVSFQVAPGDRRREPDGKGGDLVFADHRLGDPHNGDNVVKVFLDRTCPSGTWTVSLKGLSVGADGARFDAWIERDDANPCRFEGAFDNRGTLASLSTGRNTLVAAAYDATDARRPIAASSSAGPTRDGREKPDFCAPGVNVCAALSASGTGSACDSGTSLASPLLAGMVALALAEADRRGLSLDPGALRGLLQKSTRPGEIPGPGGWHWQYGWGRPSAAALLGAIAALPAAPPP